MPIDEQDVALDIMDEQLVIRVCCVKRMYFEVSSTDVDCPIEPEFHVQVRNDVEEPIYFYIPEKTNEQIRTIVKEISCEYFATTGNGTFVTN